MRKGVLIFIFSLGSLFAQQTKFFRTYSLGLYDVGEAVLAINDTNYIVAGTSTVTGMNGTDMLLFKTNSVGDVVWWKNYGGYGIQSAKGVVMAIDSSGYLLAGYKNNFDSTGYDVWLVKTNLLGDTMWTRTYGGGDWEVAHSITKMADSTYIIAGETYSFGNGQRDMYLIKINAIGDTLWTKTFGGTGNDIAKYVYVDRNEHLLVVGNTESFGAGMSDVYLAYLDANGDSLWTKTIGTVEDDFGYSAEMYIDTSNTLRFAIGYTSYYVPDLAQNSYILLVDTIAGNSLSLIPQLEANVEILDHIKLRINDVGQYYYTSDIKYGYNQTAIIYNCIKYPNIGVTGVQVTYGSGGNENTMPNDIWQTLDRGYVVTGYSENWGPGPTSCFLLKTDSMLNAPNAPQIGIENLSNTELQLFPNPVQGEYFYINAGIAIHGVNIFNLTGQLVKTYAVGNDSRSVALQKPQVVPGIYLVEILTSAGLVCRKVIF